MLPSRRYATLRPFLKAKAGLDGHFQALGDWVDGPDPDPAVFFEQGLALLVRRLNVDWALISRATDTGVEAFWWVAADGAEPQASVLEAAHAYGAFRPGPLAGAGDWVAEAPEHGIGACLGAALTPSVPVRGLLSVLSRGRRRFCRSEIALVKAVAALFGKALESEQLRYDLRMAQDALDLTSAVMEDSRLEAPGSGLPNQLYLDVWLKSNLFLARRRGEAMVLVRWRSAGTPGLASKLQALAGTLRGEDLLVDLGAGEFLLLLPRTTREGAQVLLARAGQELGHPPMGATLWDPLVEADRADLTLHGALRRTRLALHRGGERRGGTTWEG